MEKLTDEQIEEFRDAFKAFDRDNSGFITAKELARCLRTLGLNPTERELHQLVNEVDFDGNGKVDFHEFVSMMLLNGDQIAWSEKDLLEAFHTFDSDNKGYMSADELKHVLLRMDDDDVTETDIVDLVKETNLNRNRKITFNEFKYLAKPERKLHSHAAESHKKYGSNTKKGKSFFK